MNNIRSFNLFNLHYVRDLTKRDSNNIIVSPLRKVFIREIKHLLNLQPAEYTTIVKFVNSPKNRGRLCISRYSGQAVAFLLFGVDSILLDNLIFKGGTALKKMHFPDYRYSEDLDFTLLNDNLSNKEIFAEFNKIIRIIKDESNITLKLVNEYEHKKSKSINFHIAYVGTLKGKLTS